MGRTYTQTNYGTGSQYDKSRRVNLGEAAQKAYETAYGGYTPTQASGLRDQGQSQYGGAAAAKPGGGGGAGAMGSEANAAMNPNTGVPSTVAGGQSVTPPPLATPPPNIDNNGIVRGGGNPGQGTYDAYRAQVEADQQRNAGAVIPQREGSLPGEYTPQTPGANGYVSAKDAGLTMGDVAQPGQWGYNDRMGGGGGGSINAGLQGYMTPEQLAAARQAPTDMTSGGVQPGNPLRLVSGYENGTPEQRAQIDAAQALINSGGILPQNGSVRAPGAFTGPGAPGAGAQGIRNDLTQSSGSAPDQVGSDWTIKVPGDANNPALYRDAQGKEWIVGPAGQDGKPSYIEENGTMQMYSGGGAGTSPGAKGGGVDYNSYPGARDKKGKWGKIPKDYNAGGLDIGTGIVDPDLIRSIDDKHVQDLLLKYNDIFGKYQTMLGPGGGGFNQNQQSDIMSKLKWFEDNLPQMGFNLGQPTTPNGGGSPPVTPAPVPGGGGTEPAPGTGGTAPSQPTVPGWPTATRGETDLAGGVPAISTGDLPSEITRMFGFKPGEKVSSEKMAAAVSAYMDMYRENKGQRQQQLGVNEMDRALGEIRTNPLRKNAETDALALSKMGDPTNWDTVKNQFAGDTAQGARDAISALSSQGARLGRTTGDVSGAASSILGKSGDTRARGLADLANLEAQQGYDYKARGIDALTNTFGATQTPLTNAQMMLSQALMGQAPYSQQFGSGTNLFDSATGLKAIKIAEDAAKDAGNVGGLTQALGYGGSLANILGGAYDSGIFGLGK